MPESEDLRWGQRRRLPDKRPGTTVKLRIDGYRWPLYLRTGHRPDGTVGEVFLDVGREGDFAGGMFSAFATALSIGLQHGVPLETFAKAFGGTTFPPSGVVRVDTGDEDGGPATSVHGVCTSVPDLVVAHLTDEQSRAATGRTR